MIVFVMMNNNARFKISPMIKLYTENPSDIIMETAYTSIIYMISSNARAIIYYAISISRIKILSIDIFIDFIDIELIMFYPINPHILYHKPISSITSGGISGSHSVCRNQAV